MTTIRWNIVVSAETDRAVRMLLASRGGRKGDLSRFIEEAVRDRLFDETAQMITSNNSDISGEEIDRAVEEAIEWARLGQ